MRLFAFEKELRRWLRGLIIIRLALLRPGRNISMSGRGNSYLVTVAAVPLRHRLPKHALPLLSEQRAATAEVLPRSDD